VSALYAAWPILSYVIISLHLALSCRGFNRSGCFATSAGFATIAGGAADFVGCPTVDGVAIGGGFAVSAGVATFAGCAVLLVLAPVSLAVYHTVFA
jgi:hypothetical protein